MSGVEIEDRADLLGRGGEHVQVVEGTLVPEASKLPIAHNLQFTESKEQGENRTPLNHKEE